MTVAVFDILLTVVFAAVIFAGLTVMRNRRK